MPILPVYDQLPIGVKLNDYDQTESFQKVVLTVRTENFSETILDRFFFNRLSGMNWTKHQSRIRNTVFLWIEYDQFRF